jgi:hypothetical protein
LCEAFPVRSQVLVDGLATFEFLGGFLRRCLFRCCGGRRFLFPGVLLGRLEAGLRQLLADILLFLQAGQQKLSLAIDIEVDAVVALGDEVYRLEGRLLPLAAVFGLQ